MGELCTSTTSVWCNDLYICLSILTPGAPVSIQKYTGKYVKGIQDNGIKWAPPLSQHVVRGVRKMGFRIFQRRSCLTLLKIFWPIDLCNERKRENSRWMGYRLLFSTSRFEYFIYGLVVPTIHPSLPISMACTMVTKVIEGSGFRFVAHQFTILTKK